MEQNIVETPAASESSELMSESVADTVTSTTKTTFDELMAALSELEADDILPASDYRGPSWRESHRCYYGFLQSGKPNGIRDRLVESQRSHKKSGKIWEQVREKYRFWKITVQPTSIQTFFAKITWYLDQTGVQVAHSHWPCVSEARAYLAGQIIQPR